MGDVVADLSVLVLNQLAVNYLMTSNGYKKQTFTLYYIKDSNYLA